MDNIQWILSMDNIQWILSHRGILSEMDSGYYSTQMERRDWSDSFVYVTIIIIVLFIYLFVTSTFTDICMDNVQLPTIEYSTICLLNLKKAWELFILGVQANKLHFCT